MKYKLITIILLTFIFSCNKENALVYTKKYFNTQKELLNEERNKVQKDLDSLSIVHQNSLIEREKKRSTFELIQEELINAQMEQKSLENEIVILKETISLLSENTDSLSNQFIANQNKMLSIQKSLMVQIQQLQQKEKLYKIKVKDLEKQLRTTNKEDLSIGKVITVLGAEGNKFTALKIDLSTYKIQIHLERGEENKGSLEQLQKHLEAAGEEVLFMMNAGMFTNSFYPKGLYVEKGKEYVAIDRKKEGFGNFYLKENGVFHLSKKNKAGITTTSNYHLESNQLTLATQSGPMLLVEGEYNPILGKDSPNFHYRNGIGIIDENTVVMLISEEPIRFYQLAQQFKNMGCTQALYLDGAISGCWSKGRENQKGSNHFGPILSVCKSK